MSSQSTLTSTANVEPMAKFFTRVKANHKKNPLPNLISEDFLIHSLVDPMNVFLLVLVMFLCVCLGILIGYSAKYKCSMFGTRMREPLVHENTSDTIFAPNPHPFTCASRPSLSTFPQVPQTPVATDSI